MQTSTFMNYIPVNPVKLAFSLPSPLECFTGKDEKAAPELLGTQCSMDVILPTGCRSGLKQHHKKWVFQSEWKGTAGRSQRRDEFIKQLTGRD